jgi:hypothetical protein
METHMTNKKCLEISILVGRSEHPQAVIDDLWKRAVGVVDKERWQVMGTAVYVQDGSVTVTSPDDGLSLVPLEAPREELVAKLSSSVSRKPGPAGAAARLAQDNLASRRLAKAVARRKDLVDAFCGSAVVVAADLIADRAVWQLRNQTDAELVHGPVAMLHALRQVVRK